MDGHPGRTARDDGPWPTVIAIHEAWRGRPPRLVAHVCTDGATGELAVYDPAWERTLTIWFTTPRPAATFGAVGPDGVHAYAVGRLLEPWRPETIAHVVAVDLKSLSLTAEVLKGDASAGGDASRRQLGTPAPAPPTPARRPWWRRLFGGA